MYTSTNILAQRAKIQKKKKNETCRHTNRYKQYKEHLYIVDLCNCMQLELVLA